MLMSKYMVRQATTMGYTAIMTQKDRERISGDSDDPDSKKYESASRVRSRIRELEEDAEILREHHAELYSELRQAVCEDGDD